MATIKQLGRRADRLSGGHRLCGGCGAPIIARHLLLATEHPVVVTCATGCLEVSTTIYPYTAWKTPFIHSAFENAAATISGLYSAYVSLKRQGKIAQETKFLAIGGDGGTYDIGIQALSGALERGHDFVYCCYNNEAYMNTGVQRSSATPHWGRTTTSPVGSQVPGKPQPRKDLTEIVAAHNPPYVAQTSVGSWRDLHRKAEKAFQIEGPCFINALSPCPLGWITDPAKTVEICKIAADTCFWPLYEVEQGEYKVNYKPKQKLPVEAYLEPQGRFRHLLRPENKHLVQQIQDEVDRSWERLLKRAGEA